MAKLVDITGRDFKRYAEKVSDFLSERLTDVLQAIHNSHRFTNAQALMLIFKRDDGIIVLFENETEGDQRLFFNYFSLPAAIKPGEFYAIPRDILESVSLAI